MAACASGARPKFVCSTTPVALITRRSDDCCARSSAAATAAAHSVSLRGTLLPARASLIVARTALTTTERGALCNSARTPSCSSRLLTLGRLRRGSIMADVARGGRGASVDLDAPVAPAPWWCRAARDAAPRGSVRCCLAVRAAPGCRSRSRDTTCPFGTA